MRNWIAADYDLGWPVANVLITRHQLAAWGFKMIDIQTAEPFAQLLLSKLTQAENWPADAFIGRLSLPPDRDAVSVTIMSKALKRIDSFGLIPELELIFKGPVHG